MKTVFFSYSHKDEVLRDELETHLAILKRQRAISAWHDRRIKAGDPVDGSIDRELEVADVILLLVSPDFLNSDYCYGIEMERAMQRHREGRARVIPVILRPCDWHAAPFGSLMATPPDGKPVTTWANKDEAFLEIAKAIRAVVGETKTASRKPVVAKVPAAATVEPSPRSSNLRLRKTFTERDRDAFLEETFEFVAKFFENSLGELQSRNTGIEGKFKRIDANQFTATVYRDGKSLARCAIRVGGMFGRGITLALGDHLGGNGFNESLSVEIGEQSLFLRAIGMGTSRVTQESQLSEQGAAEYLWSLFIEPLQR